MSNSDTVLISFRGSAGTHSSAFLGTLVITLAQPPRLIHIVEGTMDRQAVVMQLKEELARINAAISALESLDAPTARRGRPRKSSGISPTSGPKRRTMSAEAREKIAAAQRRRWAKQKRQAGSTSSNVKIMPKSRKGISAAGRKKISEMMKARWAARKKAA